MNGGRRAKSAARWYDPATGRFLSEDPIAFEAGDPNLYRYVGNNVVNMVDPTGLFGNTVGLSVNYSAGYFSTSSISPPSSPPGFSILNDLDFSFQSNGQVDLVPRGSQGGFTSGVPNYTLQVSTSLNSNSYSLVNVPSSSPNSASTHYNPNPYNQVQLPSSLPRGIMSDSAFVGTVANFATYSPSPPPMSMGILVDPHPNGSMGHFANALTYPQPFYFSPAATPTQLANPNQPIVTLDYAQGTPMYTLPSNSQNTALTTLAAGFQVVTGGLQLATGWGLTKTGVGAIAGIPLAIRGTDNLQAGLNTLLTDEPTPTLLNQAVTNLTGSPLAGLAADFTADLATVRPTSQGLGALNGSFRSTYVVPRNVAPTMGVQYARVQSVAPIRVPAQNIRSPLWTSTSSSSSAQNAFGHYLDHGADFRAVNAMDYVGKAQRFLHNPPALTQSALRPNGDIIRFNPVTETFGIMDASGAAHAVQAIGRRGVLAETSESTRCRIRSVEELKMESEMTSQFACPCCGYLTMDESPPGTFLICPVCCWEDDNIQFDDPSYEGGANRVSLNSAKANFRQFGARSKKDRTRVRPPRPEETPES